MKKLNLPVCELLLSKANVVTTFIWLSEVILAWKYVTAYGRLKYIYMHNERLPFGYRQHGGKT